MVAEVGHGIIREDTQTILDAVGDNCPQTGNGQVGVLRLIPSTWPGQPVGARVRMRARALFLGELRVRPDLSNL